LYEESEYGECSGDPHKDEHLDANVGFDVELANTLGGISEYDEDGGSKNRGDCCQKSSEECKDEDEESDPSRVDRQRCKKDHDEVEDGAGEKEAEHPLRGGLEDVEDGSDFGGQSDYTCVSNYAFKVCHFVYNTYLLRRRSTD